MTTETYHDLTFERKGQKRPTRPKLLKLTEVTMPHRNRKKTKLKVKERSQSNVRDRFYDDPAYTDDISHLALPLRRNSGPDKIEASGTFNKRKNQKEQINTSTYPKTRSTVPETISYTRELERGAGSSSSDNGTHEYDKIKHGKTLEISHGVPKMEPSPKKREKRDRSAKQKRNLSLDNNLSNSLRRSLERSENSLKMTSMDRKTTKQQQKTSVQRQNASESWNSCITVTSDSSKATENDESFSGSGRKETKMQIGKKFLRGEIGIKSFNYYLLKEGLKSSKKFVEKKRNSLTWGSDSKKLQSRSEENIYEEIFFVDKNSDNDEHHSKYDDCELCMQECNKENCEYCFQDKKSKKHYFGSLGRHDKHPVYSDARKSEIIDDLAPSIPINAHILEFQSYNPNNPGVFKIETTPVAFTSDYNPISSFKPISSTTSILETNIKQISNYARPSIQAQYQRPFLTQPISAYQVPTIQQQQQQQQLVTQQLQQQQQQQLRRIRENRPGNVQMTGTRITAKSSSSSDSLHHKYATTKSEQTVSVGPMDSYEYNQRLMYGSNNRIGNGNNLSTSQGQQVIYQEPKIYKSDSKASILSEYSIRSESSNRNFRCGEVSDSSLGDSMFSYSTQQKKYFGSSESCRFGFECRRCSLDGEKCSFSDTCRYECRNCDCSSSYFSSDFDDLNYNNPHRRSLNVGSGNMSHSNHQRSYEYFNDSFDVKQSKYAQDFFKHVNDVKRSIYQAELQSSSNALLLNNNDPFAPIPTTKSNESMKKSLTNELYNSRSEKPAYHYPNEVVMNRKSGGGGSPYKSSTISHYASTQIFVPSSNSYTNNMTSKSKDSVDYKYKSVNKDYRTITGNISKSLDEQENIITSLKRSTKIKQPEYDERNINDPDDKYRSLTKSLDKKLLYAQPYRKSKRDLQNEELNHEQKKFITGAIPKLPLNENSPTMQHRQQQPQQPQQHSGIPNSNKGMPDYETPILIKMPSIKYAESKLPQNNTERIVSPRKASRSTDRANPKTVKDGKIYQKSNIKSSGESGRYLEKSQKEGQRRTKSLEKTLQKTPSDDKNFNDVTIIKQINKNLIDDSNPSSIKIKNDKKEKAEKIYKENLSYSQKKSSSLTSSKLIKNSQSLNDDLLKDDDDDDVFYDAKSDNAMIRTNSMRKNLKAVSPPCVPPTTPINRSITDINKNTVIENIYNEKSLSKNTTNDKNTKERKDKDKCKMKNEQNDAEEISIQKCNNTSNTYTDTKTNTKKGIPTSKENLKSPTTLIPPILSTPTQTTENIATGSSTNNSTMTNNKKILNSDAQQNNKYQEQKSLTEQQPLRVNSKDNLKSLEGETTPPQDKNRQKNINGKNKNVQETVDEIDNKDGKLNNIEQNVEQKSSSTNQQIIVEQQKSDTDKSIKYDKQHSQQNVSVNSITTKTNIKHVADNVASNIIQSPQKIQQQQKFEQQDVEQQQSTEKQNVAEQNSKQDLATNSKPPTTTTSELNKNVAEVIINENILTDTINKINKITETNLCIPTVTLTNTATITIPNILTETTQLSTDDIDNIQNTIINVTNTTSINKIDAANTVKIKENNNDSSNDCCNNIIDNIIKSDSIVAAAVNSATIAATAAVTTNLISADEEFSLTKTTTVIGNAQNREHPNQDSTTHHHKEYKTAQVDYSTLDTSELSTDESHLTKTSTAKSSNDFSSTDKIDISDLPLPALPPKKRRSKSRSSRDAGLNYSQLSKSQQLQQQKSGSYENLLDPKSQFISKRRESLEISERNFNEKLEARKMHFHNMGHMRHSSSTTNSSKPTYLFGEKCYTTTNPNHLIQGQNIKKSNIIGNAVNDEIYLNKSGWVQVNSKRLHDENYYSHQNGISSSNTVPHFKNTVRVIQIDNGNREKQPVYAVPKIAGSKIEELISRNEARRNISQLQRSNYLKSGCKIVDSQLASILNERPGFLPVKTFIETESPPPITPILSPPPAFQDTKSKYRCDKQNQIKAQINSNLTKQIYHPSEINAALHHQSLRTNGNVGVGVGVGVGAGGSKGMVFSRSFEYETRKPHSDYAEVFSKSFDSNLSDTKQSGIIGAIHRDRSPNFSTLTGNSPNYLTKKESSQSNLSNQQSRDNSPKYQQIGYLTQNLLQTKNLNVSHAKELPPPYSSNNNIINRKLEKPKTYSFDRNGRSRRAQFTRYNQTATIPVSRFRSFDQNINARLNSCDSGARSDLSNDELDNDDDNSAEFLSASYQAQANFRQQKQRSLTPDKYDSQGSQNSLRKQRSLTPENRSLTPEERRKKGSQASLSSRQNSSSRSNTLERKTKFEDKSLSASRSSSTSSSYSGGEHNELLPTHRRSTIRNAKAPEEYRIRRSRSLQLTERSPNRQIQRNGNHQSINVIRSSQQVRNTNFPPTIRPSQIISDPMNTNATIINISSRNNPTTIRNTNDNIDKSRSFDFDYSVGKSGNVIISNSVNSINQHTSGARLDFDKSRSFDEDYREQSNNLVKSYLTSDTHSGGGSGSTAIIGNLLKSGSGGGNRSAGGSGSSSSCGGGLGGGSGSQQQLHQQTSPQNYGTRLCDHEMTYDMLRRTLDRSPIMDFSGRVGGSGGGGSGGPDYDIPQSMINRETINAGGNSELNFTSDRIYDHGLVIGGGISSKSSKRLNHSPSDSLYSIDRLHSTSRDSITPDSSDDRLRSEFGSVIYRQQPQRLSGADRSGSGSGTAISSRGSCSKNNNNNNNKINTKTCDFYPNYSNAGGVSGGGGVGGSGSSSNLKSQTTRSTNNKVPNIRHTRSKSNKYYTHRNSSQRKPNNIYIKNNDNDNNDYDYILPITSSSVNDLLQINSDDEQLYMNIKKLSNKRLLNKKPSLSSSLIPQYNHYHHHNYSNNERIPKTTTTTTTTTTQPIVTTTTTSTTTKIGNDTKRKIYRDLNNKINTSITLHISEDISPTKINNTNNNKIKTNSKLNNNKKIISISSSSTKRNNDKNHQHQYHQQIKEQNLSPRYDQTQATADNKKLIDSLKFKSPLVQYNFKGGFNNNNSADSNTINNNNNVTPIGGGVKCNSTGNSPKYFKTEFKYSPITLATASTVIFFGDREMPVTRDSTPIGSITSSPTAIPTQFYNSGGISNNVGGSCNNNSGVISGSGFTGTSNNGITLKSFEYESGAKSLEYSGYSGKSLRFSGERPKTKLLESNIHQFGKKRSISLPNIFLDTKFSSTTLAEDVGDERDRFATSNLLNRYRAISSPSLNESNLENTQTNNKSEIRPYTTTISVNGNQNQNGVFYKFRKTFEHFKQCPPTSIHTTTINNKNSNNNNKFSSNNIIGKNFMQNNLLEDNNIIPTAVTTGTNLSINDSTNQIPATESTTATTNLNSGGSGNGGSFKNRFGASIWRNSKERRKTKFNRRDKCNSGDSGIQIEAENDENIIENNCNDQEFEIDTTSILNPNVRRSNSARTTTKTTNLHNKYNVVLSSESFRSPKKRNNMFQSNQLCGSSSAKTKALKKVQNSENCTNRTSPKPKRSLSHPGLDQMTKYADDSDTDSMSSHPEDKQPLFAEVINQFIPAGPQELALEQGALVEVIRQDDGPWWYGKIKHDEIIEKILEPQQGWFPKDFVRILNHPFMQSDSENDYNSQKNLQPTNTTTPLPDVDTKNTLTNCCDNNKIFPENENSHIHNIDSNSSQIATSLTTTLDSRNYSSNACIEQQNQQSLTSNSSSSQQSISLLETNAVNNDYDTSVATKITTTESNSCTVNTLNFQEQSLVFNINENLRRNAIKELLETEINYVNLLSTLCLGYLKEMRKRIDIFPPESLKTIFSNIEIVWDFQKTFLDALKKGVEINNIAQTFISYQNGFAVYSTYCNSYPRALMELETYSSNKDAKCIFENIRIAQNLSHLPLSAHLLAPIQRICRYPLHLAELVKHTPIKADLEIIYNKSNNINSKTETTTEIQSQLYSGQSICISYDNKENFEAALNVMKKVTENVNEGKRHSENLNRFQSSFENFQGPPIACHSTRFFMQTDATRISPNLWNNTYTLFLFDHQLIYCKKDILKRNHFMYKGRIFLDSCRILNLPDGKIFGVSLKNALRIYCETLNKWFDFCFRSSSRKLRFLSTLAIERQFCGTNLFVSELVGGNDNNEDDNLSDREYHSDYDTPTTHNSETNLNSLNWKQNIFNNGSSSSCNNDHQQQIMIEKYYETLPKKSKKFKKHSISNGFGINYQQYSNNGTVMNSNNNHHSNNNINQQNGSLGRRKIIGSWFRKSKSTNTTPNQSPTHNPTSNSNPLILNAADNILHHTNSSPALDGGLINETCKSVTNISTDAN